MFTHRDQTFIVKEIIYFRTVGEELELTLSSGDKKSLKFNSRPQRDAFVAELKSWIKENRKVKDRIF